MAKAKAREAFTVHPKKVLIKITKDQWNDLFSIWINRADGSREQLFTDTEESEGYERRFRQNVSVGNIVAAGSKVSGILKGDLAVLDYMATGNSDSLVGYHFGSMVIAIPAETTYHDKDSAPMLNGRKTWVKGDYNEVSKLLGIVRMGKLIAFRPYVFLKYEKPTKMEVSDSGLLKESVEKICIREVISAHPDSGYKDGDKVMVKELDLISRFIDKNEISVVFESDILGAV